MATLAPEGLDVTDLKFKLQNKVPIFKGDGNVKDGCSLLAAASVHGLIFVGTTGPQLKVLQLKDITPDKVIDEIVPLRTVPLPSEPFQLAVSCDHGFLAVDVVVNGVPFIYVYSVASFLTPSIVKLYEIRTSPEEAVRSTQILWNPVLHNMFSLRTENGALSVYTLKEPTGIEFHSLDKSEGAICACWSPKGKQLVVGFANGKLVQYKPDLKPARTIACPVGVMEGSFDVIAVQWLSTYQFAAVYLPHAEDSVPSLFIVNAPKAGNPTFINYDDPCYSQSGPRKGQVFLLHILQWNLLLVASANSMEVGILGTTESGETPTWYQWTTTDEARAELPLTSDKQETFPAGLALETGCTHEVTIGEQTFPVMPMIHLISTYGMLVSFNVLNLTPNVPNICSPPRPTTDLSGKFEKIDVSKQAAPAPAQQPAEISFAVPAGATSTPAVPKTKSFFSPSENKSPMNLFGSTNAGASPAIAPSFGKQITFGGVPTSAAEPPKTSPFGGGGAVSASPFGAPIKPFAAPTQTQPQQPAMGTTQPSLLKASLTQPQQKAPADATKPLVTVPPTYTPPPADVSRSGSSDSLAQQQAQRQSYKKQEPTDDTNLVIRSMIFEEIRKFQKELSDLQSRCRALDTTIGTKEESAFIIKNLKELQDLSVQAAESTESLTSDVQALRLGLNEAFAMVAEANSKNAIFKHPSPNQFQEAHAMSQSSRRQLASLQNMLAINENQLQIVNKQIDAQWSSIQEANRVNSKRRMHVPSLEVLYQTLSKQQEILNRQREKLSYIKAKLGMRESIRGLEKGKWKDFVPDKAMDSLTDSIISMTIGEQVREDAKRLSDTKMNSLRNMLKNRKVVTIKPSRPDRVGLNSEVVRERRNEVRRLNLEKEKAKAQTVKAVQPAEVVPVAPVKKVEEKPKPQPQPAAKPAPQPAKPTQVLTQPAEPTKLFELPKASSLPSFGQKPLAAAAQVPAVAPAPFGFGSTPMVSAAAAASAVSSAPAAAAKAPVLFGAPATTTSSTQAASGAPVGPVFSFGQVNQPSKPKEPVITKETTLFGSTTIKPVSATSAGSTVSASTKDKENQEPSAAKPVFGFGSTTIQAIPKQDATDTASKPVLAFGSTNANTKASSTFSFGAVGGTGGSVPFGASNNQQPAAPALNLAKEKEPEAKKEDKPKAESKKEEPASGATGNGNEESVKAAFPALTNLLQKAEPAASTAEVSSTQNIFSSAAAAPKSTSSSIFGTSTATIAPGTGLFGSIKPSTTTTTTTSGGALFSGFNFGGTTAAASTAAEVSSSPAATTTTTAGLFGSVKPAATTATTASSGFTFGSSATSGFTSAAAAEPTDLSVKSEASKAEGKPAAIVVPATSAPAEPVATTAATTAAAISTETATTSTATSTATGFTFGSVAVPATVSTPVAAVSTLAATSTPASAAVTAPTDTTANLFGSFNICSPSTPGAAKPVSSTNIFGNSSFSTPKSETTSIFGGAASTTSTFGTPAATDASKGTSVFGSPPAVTSAAAAPVSGTGLFGSVTSSTGGGSIFGGASTATSSPFGTAAPSGGLFGSVAAATPATSAGSIFGGAAISTAPPTSPFGTAAVTPATTASSIFGGGAGSTSGGGLFGAAAAAAPASTTGGSIFGGTSAFGASTGTSSGNIFGSAATSTGTTSGFGSSAFGQPSSQSGQSIFGGASTTSAFGSSSFGSPTPSVGGAFSQPTGGSVSQAGFGSPSTTSAFGATPAFGGAPTFGGAPSFGGAPAFGSPPAFGSKPMFGSPSGFGQPPLSPSSQSNNLFEQLGSSSSGVSFGNLAQQQAQKPPQFGGSSFSSWR